MPTRTLAPRALVGVLVAFMLVIVASAAAVAAPCDPDGADATAVADARAAVQAQCDCASAASAGAWSRCVRTALAGSAGSGLSTSCRNVVRKLETRATCGRSGQVVCCRTTASGRTTGSLRRPGRCNAPRNGTACESTIDYIADACLPDGSCATEPVATCGDFVLDPGETCDPPDGQSCSATCTLCLPDGCIAPSSCGDGNVDAGETCDPPNGTTCSRSCTSCAPAESGEILVGCSADTTAVPAGALPDALLVAFTDVSPGGARHVVARRIAADGAFLDATPLAVSGLLPGTFALGGSTQTVTTDGTDFYVGWSTYAGFASYFGGRRVPGSGSIASGPDVIASDFPFGSCRASMSPPLKLAPKLDGSGFRATWSVVYSCLGQVLFQTVAGVGPFFNVPPPGNLSAGPAPIVRGASDVAAIWWNAAITSTQPPIEAVETLAASFVEPGAASMIHLTPGSSSVAPALAAVGDTFVALFASGNELRAVRFTRAAGALDPAGGILVATGTGPIEVVAAASDGSLVTAAWRESAGPGQSAIRAIRIAPDGTIPDPSPVAVATSDAGAAIGVAASPAATLVTFSRAEAAGSSVRAVLLDD